MSCKATLIEADRPGSVAHLRAMPLIVLSSSSTAGDG